MSLLNKFYHQLLYAPGAVANRLALEACVKARNEGHDLAWEGNEIIREACKWSPGEGDEYTVFPYIVKVERSLFDSCVRREDGDAMGLMRDGFDCSSCRYDQHILWFI